MPLPSSAAAMLSAAPRAAGASLAAAAVAERVIGIRGALPDRPGCRGRARPPAGGRHWSAPNSARRCPVWWSRKRTPSGSRRSRSAFLPPVACAARKCRGTGRRRGRAGRPCRGAESTAIVCIRVSPVPPDFEIATNCVEASGSLCRMRSKVMRVEIVEEVDARALGEAPGARHRIVLQLRQRLPAEARAAGAEERRHRSRRRRRQAAASRMRARSSVVRGMCSSGSRPDASSSRKPLHGARRRAASAASSAACGRPPAPILAARARSIDCCRAISCTPTRSEAGAERLGQRGRPEARVEHDIPESVT